MCTKSRKKGEVGQKRSGWRFLKKVCGVYEYSYSHRWKGETRVACLTYVSYMRRERQKRYIYICMYVYMYIWKNKCLRKSTLRNARKNML